MWNLCVFGHVATTGLLRRHETQRAISSAANSGVIRRVGRGLYCCPHLDEEAMAALAAGCLIDCTSALRRHDRVWSGSSPSLHLRAAPHQHLRRLPSRALVHWATAAGSPVHVAEVAPLDALLQAMTCLEPIDALACIESALHVGYLGEQEFDELIDRAPDRMRRTLARLDRGAQSGLETHARIRLLDAGHHVRTQFIVPGAGPFDLLVDGCVAVETDGERWHGPDRFIADRTKLILAEEAGIRCLRIARTHIFDSWPRTLAAIARMVFDARRSQLRTSSRGRASTGANAL